MLPHILKVRWELWMHLCILAAANRFVTCALFAALVAEILQMLEASLAVWWVVSFTNLSIWWEAAQHITPVQHCQPCLLRSFIPRDIIQHRYHYVLSLTVLPNNIHQSKYWGGERRVAISLFVQSVQKG